MRGWNTMEKATKSQFNYKLILRLKVCSVSRKVNVIQARQSSSLLIRKKQLRCGSGKYPQLQLYFEPYNSTNRGKPDGPSLMLVNFQVTLYRFSSFVLNYMVFFSWHRIKKPQSSFSISL